jgi:hypothetical protein
MSGTVTLATVRMIVPLNTVPSQVLNTVLNGQYCQINVYTRSTGLYVDIGMNGLTIIGGVIAQDRNRIVREPYRGFIGDIAFWDSIGTTDPFWQGIGSRFWLGYWSS